MKNKSTTTKAARKGPHATIEKNHETNAKIRSMKHPIIPSLGLAVLVGVSLVTPAHAAVVTLDDFNLRQGNSSVYALAGESMSSTGYYGGEVFNPGTIAGNRVTYVSSAGIDRSAY